MRSHPPVITAANASRLRRVRELRPGEPTSAHDHCLAFDPRGARVVAMGAAGTWARWWSLEEEGAASVSPREPLAQGGPRCLLPDADHVLGVGRASPASGGSLLPDGLWRPRLVLLSARDGALVRQEPLPHAVTALACSRDGQRVAVVMDEGAVLLWDVREWRLVRALEGMPGVPGSPSEVVVSRCAFSPDGRYLAAVSTRWSEPRTQGLVWLWDLVTGEGPWCLSLDTPVSHGLAFHPTKPWLAVSGGERFVAVIDVEARRPLRQSPGFFGYGCHLDFGATGDVLLASADGFGFTVHDFETGGARFEVRQEGNVSDACFSPDGRFIAYGEWGGVVSLWAVED